MLPEDLQLKVQDCILNFKRIELGSMIGQGTTEEFILFKIFKMEFQSYI